MSVVIIAYGPLRPSISGDPAWAINGEFVERYDPDAHNGRGDAKFTDDLDKALKFKSVAEAKIFAMRVPKERPVRADGVPNRPLRTFHLDFKEIEP